jgi:hypothetical protein
LQPDCEQVIFSTTKLQPTAQRSNVSLDFVPVFVFDHFAFLRGWPCQPRIPAAG